MLLLSHVPDGVCYQKYVMVLVYKYTVGHSLLFCIEMSDPCLLILRLCDLWDTIFFTEGSVTVLKN